MTTQNNVENILVLFRNKIKKSLNNTPYQEREDLEQELLVKIIEKVKYVEFEEPEGFWDLLAKFKSH